MRWGLLALLAGCGGSSANAPLHKFPSQEELLRLQQVPRPTKVIAAPLAPSAGWAPATAPAEAVAQGGYEDPSPAGQALQRLAAERGLRLSGGLRCVPRRRAASSSSAAPSLARACGASWRRAAAPS